MGSTYLAIRVMVRTIPPLLGMGSAALLLYGFCVLRRRHVPQIGIVFTGVLTLGVGERTAPLTLAALLIASVPLWGYSRG